MFWFTDDRIFRASSFTDSFQKFPRIITKQSVNTHDMSEKLDFLKNLSSVCHITGFLEPEILVHWK